MTISRTFFIVFLAQFVIACEDPKRSTYFERENTAETVFEDRPVPDRLKAPVPVSKLSNELALIFMGLVSESVLDRDNSVVDLFATAQGWSPIPSAKNQLLNAQNGYVGNVAGVRAMLASDGTNRIFSLTVGEGFDPREVTISLGQFVTLQKIAADNSMGQTMEMFKILDDPVPLGILSLTYGTADSIQGIGTIGFISVAEAKTEGIGEW